MMGRDMFRRRKKATAVKNEPSRTPTDIDYAAAERIIADASTSQDSSWRVIKDGPAQPANPGPEVTTDFYFGSPTGTTGDDGEPVTETIVREAPQPARNILAAEPVTARFAVPQLRVSPTRETCTNCGGTGHMPNVSDLLRESAGWIDDMDGVIVAFYNRMLEIARKDAEDAAYEKTSNRSMAWAAGEEAVQDLAYIFPDDLLSAAAGGDSKGAGQRDRLAKALVALATTYDPADGEAMERLDNVIRSMGGRHAAFVRRNGTISGASFAEYDIAKRALMDVLGTLPQLTAAHAEAWSLAYDYTAGGMMQEQQRSGFTAPRFPRP